MSDLKTIVFVKFNNFLPCFSGFKNNFYIACFSCMITEFVKKHFPNTLTA